MGSQRRGAEEKEKVREKSRKRAGIKTGKKEVGRAGKGQKKIPGKSQDEKQVKGAGEEGWGEPTGKSSGEKKQKKKVREKSGEEKKKSVKMKRIRKHKQMTGK